MRYFISGGGVTYQSRFPVDHFLDFRLVLTLNLPIVNYPQLLDTVSLLKIAAPSSLT